MSGPKLQGQTGYSFEFSDIVCNQSGSECFCMSGYEKIVAADNLPFLLKSGTDDAILLARKFIEIWDAYSGPKAIQCF